MAVVSAGSPLVTHRCAGCVDPAPSLSLDFGSKKKAQVLLSPNKACSQSERPNWAPNASLYWSTKGLNPAEERLYRFGPIRRSHYLRGRGVFFVFCFLWGFFLKKLTPTFECTLMKTILCMYNAICIALQDLWRTLSSLLSSSELTALVMAWLAWLSSAKLVLWANVVTKRRHQGRDM